MARMKRVLKAVMPTVLWSVASRLRGSRGVSFQGDYPSWETAEKAAGGYDEPAILEKVRQAALRVKRGEAVFERDSVCFYHEEYRWPTLACLLRIAAEGEGRLRVVDFGGSLGSFWFQHRKHLSGLKEVRWAVVEQSHYVACGREEFQDETLRFAETIEEAGPADVIFCSSVLQYLPDPYTWIKRFAMTGVKWLMLDRTAFIKSYKDRILIQTVPMWRISLPTWYLSYPRLVEVLKELGYSLECQFDSDDSQIEADFLGILLKRI